MPVLPYGAKMPQLADDVFVAPGAHVIGDVQMGASCSVWFGTQVRGDVHHIRIGDRVNIQDNSVVHVTTNAHPTIIGHDVTVGHRVILHGCTVGAGALIGMGAIVMDRAVIGEGALIAAGALVPEGVQIPAGVLAIGAPAKVKRPLTAEEQARLKTSAGHYVNIARQYVSQLGFRS
ncbi:MAG: gamma carbonic anhydrase family protein [Myxococcota bacterium]